MEAEGVVVKTMGRTSLLVGSLSRTIKSIGSFKKIFITGQGLPPETLNDSSKC